MNVAKLLRFASETRVDSIMSWPSSVLLTSRWIRRILCALAVLVSWAFMYSISPIAPLPFASLQWLEALVMIVTLLLLRRSVRRVTSLPDAYLDELEIANRDWAFRMGYLVVRRIGLFVSLALVGILLAAWFANGAKSIFEAGWGISTGKDAWINMFVFAADAIQHFFASEPVTAAAKLMGLLTYVAYSFPIILLAWRSSNSLVEPIDLASWPEDFARYSRSYFKRLLTFGILVGAFWLLVATRSEIVIFCLFVAIAFGIYVFFWGLAIQIEMLLKLRSVHNSPKAASQLKRLRWFVIAATVVALPIPLIPAFGNYLYLNSIALFMPIVLGLILVILHVVSFSSTLRLPGNQIRPGE